MYRKLHAISKKRLCDVVGEWSHSISNHLYWCAASSNGNGDLISQKWLSILNNVVDVHEGHGDLYPRCLHGPLDDRDWLKQGTTQNITNVAYCNRYDLYLHIRFNVYYVCLILNRFQSICGIGGGC